MAANVTACHLAQVPWLPEGFGKKKSKPGSLNSKILKLQALELFGDLVVFVAVQGLGSRQKPEGLRTAPHSPELHFTELWRFSPPAEIATLPPVGGLSGTARSIPAPEGAAAWPTFPFHPPTQSLPPLSGLAG